MLMTGVDRGELRAYLRETKRDPPTTHTPSNEKVILARVEAAAADGFTISYQENDLDVAAVSVAIKDYLGDVVAAISITGPLSRWNELHIRETLPAILENCAGLSRAMGSTGNAFETTPSWPAASPGMSLQETHGLRP
jgi:DNA-binding IclR family transcriptional regulator